MPAIAELIARAQADDQQAMEQIIAAYQGRVAAMVISLIGDDQDWEDVCQQIFVKMILGLRRLKQVEAFEPWLFRIARNAAFDHLRRRRTRRILVPWQKSHDSIAGEQHTAVNLKSAALDNAVIRLPPDERELIALIRERHCSYSRLTRLTGQSLSAVKSRLFRARRRLRQLMTDA
ncbi:MAG: RNA polymerase sigma factor [Deltaproteobacteria bacterium]|nr:RNA polymerase sigma factor [Deltaproteobacteria bacterium]